MIGLFGGLEMPRCPKCGEEISILLDWSRTWVLYYFNGEDYECAGESHTDNADEFACPKCGEVLFYDGEEARKFLKKH